MPSHFVRCSVTRLIKASKSQKPNKDSLLQSPSSSNLSVLSGSSGGHPSHSYTPLHSLNLSSKLSAAQSELQACEAQLAAKERQLEAAREEAVREGLRARCTAMVECGWAWGEMGKEGLRAIEDMFSQGTTAPSLPLICASSNTLST